MGFIPFIRIIFSNQLKNKASSVGSILGVIIAIAFITGTFMTSEAIVSDLFTSELEDLEVHFTAYRWYRQNSGSNDEDMMEDLREMKGIKEAGLVHQMHSNLYLNYSYTSIISGDEKGLEMFYGKNISVPKGDNMTFISSELAEKNGLQIGDTYNLTMEVYLFWADEYYHDGEPITLIGDEILEEQGPVYYNYTMTVAGFVDRGSDSFDDYIYRNIGAEIVMDLETIEKLQANISAIPETWVDLSSSIYITMNPSYYSNIDDIKGTVKETNQLKRNIEKAIGPADFEMESDRIGDVYDDYIYWSTTMRVFLVIMSLPLFLLCFYLVLIGSRIGMDSKVQEISLLKVKGAGKSHILSMLMIESLTHGILGSLLGLLSGSLLSSMFIGQFLDHDVPINSLLPSLTMTIVITILACIFVILIRLRSIWRLSKMNILEAARGSPERKDKRYKPTLDIVIVSVIFILIGIMSYFNESRPSGLGALAVYSVVETIKPILVLFLPFLLILSLSRVLILGIPGILSLVAKPLKGLNKELHSLLLAGLKFGKRKIAIMAILISISLSFGILVLSQMETREASIDATIHASIPTDVYAAAPGNCWPMEENISSIEGVRSLIVARGFSFSGSIGQEGYGEYFWSRAIGLNSSTYEAKVDYPSNIIIEGEGPASLRSYSNMPGILVNKPFTEEFDIGVGDIINLTMTQQWSIGGNDDNYYMVYYESFVEFQVTGIVDHLPGLRSEVDRELLESRQYYYDSWVTSELAEWPCLYIDLFNIPQEIGSETWIYLVEVAGSSKDVERSIQELYWKNNINITTTKDRELQNIEDIPANRGMDLVMLIQFGCVLVSVIVGLFLLQTVSNASRKREFAEIMSRGATRDNIFRLLLSEGIVVMTLGLLIGTGVGFLVGYSFQSVFTGDWTSSIGDFGSEIDIQNSISIESSVIFPPTIFIIHVVTIVSSLVTVFIVSMLSSKIDIASHLRLRRS